MGYNVHESDFKYIYIGSPLVQDRPSLSLVSALVLWLMGYVLYRWIVNTRRILKAVGSIANLCTSATSATQLLNHN